MTSSGAAASASSRRRFGNHNSAATGPASSVPEPRGIAPDRGRDRVRGDAPERVQRDPGAQRRLGPRRAPTNATTGDEHEAATGSRARTGSFRPPGTRSRAARPARARRRSRPRRRARALIRRGSRPARPIAYAAPTSAENSAATGLESAVSAPIAVARPGLRRDSASAAAVAGSIPNANVSRPVYRFVAVAAPNHSAPSHASSPN